mmetsp:Transcript_29707/g.78286  ORF Transcript_29707/g.78286 Transcript_29707/m.78286 type:complete len:253 (-) Transcript_29707:737-1495(-)
MTIPLPSAFRQIITAKTQSVRPSAVDCFKSIVIGTIEPSMIVASVRKSGEILSLVSTSTWTISTGIRNLTSIRPFQTAKFRQIWATRIPFCTNKGLTLDNSAVFRCVRTPEIFHSTRIIFNTTHRRSIRAANVLYVTSPLTRTLHTPTIDIRPSRTSHFATPRIRTIVSSPRTFTSPWFATIISPARNLSTPCFAAIASQKIRATATSGISLSHIVGPSLFERIHPFHAHFLRWALIKMPLTSCLKLPCSPL